MVSDDDLRIKARGRAEAKAGFYAHLGIYIIVNAGLLLLWFTTSPNSFPWPLIVMGFWGIGLVSHAVSVFSSGRYMDRMADREYERMRERK